jgi:hypothetical protein
MDLDAGDLMRLIIVDCKGFISDNVGVIGVGLLSVMGLTVVITTLVAYWRYAERR